MNMNMYIKSHIFQFIVPLYLNDYTYHKYYTNSISNILFTQEKYGFDK